MTKHAEKLVKYLIAINFAGILTGVAFYLIGGVIAGLTGFLIGLFGSAFLIRQKNTENSSSAGVLNELVGKS